MKLLIRRKWTLSFLRAILAEFLGTAVFVFASLASTIIWNQIPLNIQMQKAHSSDNPVHISLTFGISVAVMSYCMGPISGAHLNPAVTSALLAGLRISPIKAVSYIFAQVLGAITASGFLYGLTPGQYRGNLGINSLSPGVTQLQAVGIEMAVTFQLVLCVFASSERKKDLANCIHLVVGLSVTLGHLVAIGYTGCSMNPARSLGPAVIISNYKNHWIFWMGPLAGGLLGTILYDFILAPRWKSFTDWQKMLKMGLKEESD
uniref:Aquaporin 1 (Colton blood group) n=1 Tax=Latimeria chalumnae TaxID=7897 RepID=H3BBE0_LATCH